MHSPFESKVDAGQITDDTVEVYVVEELSGKWPALVDTLWLNEEKANMRAAELNAAEGAEYTWGVYAWTAGE